MQSNLLRYRNYSEDYMDGNTYLVMLHGTKID